MRIQYSVILVAIAATSTIAQTLSFDLDTTVRRARASGVCHPPGTVYYARVKSFDTMPMRNCLARDGGRLPRNFEAYEGVLQAALRAELVAMAQAAAETAARGVDLARRQDVAQNVREAVAQAAQDTLLQPLGLGVAGQQSMAETVLQAVPDLIQQALAQEAEQAAVQAADQAGQEILNAQGDAALERGQQAEDNTREFAGFKFGIGIAAILFDEPRIENVDIDNGTVFVREKRDVDTSILFETHKFFTFEGSSMGVGPFVAASLAQEDGANPLSIFAAGVMMGWKRPNSSSSWNVGLGLIVDTDALEFREGISDGASTTIANPDDLTRTVNQNGLILLFSASW